MIIIPDGTAHTSPVGESLGECLVRGRRPTKVNSLSGLCCPPAPRGPRHSGLQSAPPHAGPHKGPHSSSLTKRPIHPGPLGLPPPAAPRASPLVSRAARQASRPAHNRAARLRTPARFFSHGWHTPATSDWLRSPAASLDWVARSPHGRGRSLPQRAPIGLFCARVGGAFLAGPPLFLLRPKPRDGPGSR